MVSDNLDPYVGISETLSNIKEDDLLENIFYAGGWGYISGHNAGGIKQYAEHYYRNGSKYIYGINLNASLVSSQVADSKIVLKIWEGDFYPEQELYRKDIYNFELSAGTENLIRLDTLILVDKHFFVGYEISYKLPIDTFALFLVSHDDNDSLNTAFTQIEGDWQPLTDGENVYSASLAISPLVLDYYPSPDAGYGNFPYDDVTIYPNPANYEQQIVFKERVNGDVHLSVFDLMGNKLLEQSFISPEPNIKFETDNLPEGLFVLRIDYNGRTSVKKFIKFR
jgi:hypothetical protein